MIKKYYEREDGNVHNDDVVNEVNVSVDVTLDQHYSICTTNGIMDDDVEAENVPETCIKMQNSVLKNLENKLSHLKAKEKSEMTSIINEYKGLFSDNPSRTSVIEHDVDVTRSVTCQSIT